MTYDHELCVCETKEKKWLLLLCLFIESSVFLSSIRSNSGAGWQLSVNRNYLYSKQWDFTKMKTKSMQRPLRFHYKSTYLNMCVVFLSVVVGFVFAIIKKNISLRAGRYNNEHQNCAKGCWACLLKVSPYQVNDMSMLGLYFVFSPPKVDNKSVTAGLMHGNSWNIMLLMLFCCKGITGPLICGVNPAIGIPKQTWKKIGAEFYTPVSCNVCCS